MDIQEKLEILADAGQYDLACACGTRNPDEHRRRDPGNRAWLYPVSLPRGGSGIMLKTLLSSSCVGDCAYCPLRTSVDHFRRCTLGADELARIFLEYNRRRRLLGLFVSSGVIRDSDHTMQRLNAVAAILRRKYAYRGYIHIKIIPGASDAAIAEAMRLASAVSVNIETPSAAHCRVLSSRKDWERDILRSMRLIAGMNRELPAWRRVRQTTQFIVGAAAESDREIVDRSFELYGDIGLDRIYFSAYQPGLGKTGIPGEEKRNPDILAREHRLYQTEFLIRRYGFGRNDFSFGRDGSLPLDRDPKQCWADANPDFFPVRVGTAEDWQLLRVPGLGPISVKRIVDARLTGGVRSLRDVGLTGKRGQLAASYLDFS